MADEDKTTQQAEQQPLTKEMVGESTLSRLSLRLGPGRVDVAVYNPLENGSLLTRSRKLSDEGGDAAAYLKSLEDFIYANPLLLCDFASTDVIVETSCFAVVPAELSDDDSVRMLHLAHPDMEKDAAVEVTRLPELGAAVAMGLPQPLVSFLRRTFPAVTLAHSMVPLMRFFRSKIPAGNSVKALVNFRDDSADIIIEKHSGLLLANRYESSEPADLLYYVLSAVSRITPKAEEVYLSGSRTLRDAVTPELRRFHPYVMPMIFPSEMFRAGSDAMTMPFDLAILPLCKSRSDNKSRS